MKINCLINLVTGKAFIKILEIKINIKFSLKNSESSIKKEI